MITVFDLETTGLVKAKGIDIAHQPYITEVYAIQLDNRGNIKKEFESYIKPPIPIPDYITKITNINDYTVKDAPIFLEVYKKIIEIFFCSHTVVAHNLTFDEQVLIFELQRIGKEYHFPYPPVKFCTVEQSMYIKGHRLKNGELYKIATGREIEGAHKAKNDVMATYESYKWLRRQKS